MSHNRSRTDKRARPDRDPRQDSRIAANTRTLLYESRNYVPVVCVLQSTFVRRGCRINIVREHDTVADENFIFDYHTFTYETVRRNLAAFTHNRVLLNLNESADSCICSDSAAVKINQLGMKYGHVGTKDDVCCYRHFASNNRASA